MKTEDEGIRTLPASGKATRIHNKGWQCSRCGICCRFIYIPVKEPIDLETEEYLMSHGICYDGEKLIIPAVCRHLALEYKKEGENGFVYRCNIHDNKFANCRLGGEKECVEAQKAWELLVETVKGGQKKPAKPAYVDSAEGSKYEKQNEKIIPSKRE